MFFAALKEWFLLLKEFRISFPKAGGQKQKFLSD
jgi:hypothetical protein